MLQIQRLGHGVLQVSDLERSEHFYTDELGFVVAARMESPHDVLYPRQPPHFAISGLGADAVAPSPKSPGPAHVAFKIGDSTELRQAKTHLDALGVEIAMMADHTVS